LIRVLFGLSGSASLAALTAPGTALAQQELPEIRVIATTPIPASGPNTRGTPGGPPTPVRDPDLIDRDKVPSNTQTLTPQDFEPWKSSSVPDALMRRVPGVFINDLAVNPFQPEIQYRGFVASPTVGAPQGVAVYQNGVRINEAFGDTVNWDFIPERAINRLDVHPSNPIFGLNALGGAVSVEMKNGFTYTGKEIESVFGSFGRRGVGEFGAAPDLRRHRLPRRRFGIPPQLHRRLEPVRRRRGHADRTTPARLGRGLDDAADVQEQARVPQRHRRRPAQRHLERQGQRLRPQLPAETRRRQHHRRR
jgi:hypothetical protein